MHDSSSGSTIGSRARRTPDPPAVKPLTYVASQSMTLASAAGTKSTNPMPSTLPAVTSVRPSSTIERTRGDVGVGQVGDPEPAGDVGVERGAGDVLAAALDDQHVDVVERQRRHQRPRLLGQLPLGGTADVVGAQRPHGDDVVERRLDRGDAAEQPAGVAQGGDAGQEVVAHPDGGVGVELGRARLLAEADDGHLRAAALDRALERRVRLDPVDGHDPVGAGGVGVEVEPAARRRCGRRPRCPSSPGSRRPARPRSCRAWPASPAARRRWPRRGCPSPARRTGRRRARAAR